MLQKQSAKNILCSFVSRWEYRHGAVRSASEGSKLMSETVTTEPQGANTPARQLLAVLTRASQDMEKAISDSYEYVSRLNAELQQTVNSQLDESAEQVEQLIKGHLAGVSSGKDSIISQLTELRQEELKTLQNTGKELRQALLEKLEELVSAFSSQTEMHLKKFEEDLAKTGEISSTDLDAVRQTLKEKTPKYLESIRNEISKEKNLLQEKQAKFQQTLEESSTVSNTELKEHCAELKARLESEGAIFLGSVEESAESLIAEQKKRLSQRTESFALMDQLAGERIAKLSESDSKFIKELPENFNQSSKELSELRVSLHATMVKNLALQYRTELLSAAQDAEDHLQIVRGELQSTLKQYQNNYAEQFQNLLSRFERTAADLSSRSEQPDNESGKGDDEIVALVNEQCSKIKKLASEQSREKVSATEGTMEKSYEEFRLSLENIRKAACEKIESGFKERQEELMRIQQGNEEQLNSLSKELEQMEQAVAEAKDLISALDQASLDCLDF